MCTGGALGMCTGGALGACTGGAVVLHHARLLLGAVWRLAARWRVEACRSAACRDLPLGGV
eukprot:358456-Chlamydomonas_euryale.AAC.7